MRGGYYRCLFTSVIARHMIKKRIIGLLVQETQKGHADAGSAVSKAGGTGHIFDH